MGQDFVGTVTRVAEIGYAGVETAGFPGTTPQEARRLFDDLGLTVVAAHTPLPVGEQQNQALDVAAQLGCDRIVCAALRPDPYYASPDQIRKTCDLVNEAAEIASANGLKLGMHNHWWEFEPVDGVYPYRAWLEYLNPAVFFEIDTYWARVAGHDPVQVLQEFGARAPLLHLKDGPGVQGEPNVALGEGVMDIPAIVQASAGVAEWLIVEFDHCATDVLEAVARSFEYLSTL